MSTYKLSTTYVCFPELKCVFKLYCLILLLLPILFLLYYYYLVLKHLFISLWRITFRYYSFKFVLGSFCSFVHTRLNISDSFQRRDWNSLKSSIFCDKTQHILKVWIKSHEGTTNLRSWKNEKSLTILKYTWRKQRNYLFSGLSSSLGFSGIKKYQKCMWIQR